MYVFGFVWAPCAATSPSVTHFRKSHHLLTLGQKLLKLEYVCDLQTKSVVITTKEAQVVLLPSETGTWILGPNNVHIVTL